MQHKRSRLTTKILAFVLILALVFPASAFASVADVAKDTRAPGKSLANTYPAYTDIDWQISLAENAQVEVTVPTNMTAEELGAAMNGGLTLSLDRDSTRGYLDPEKFPYPYQGGALDTWMTQWKQDKQPQNLFRITDTGMSADEAGKVTLKLWIDINCYFGNRSGSLPYESGSRGLIFHTGSVYSHIILGFGSFLSSGHCLVTGFCLIAFLGRHYPFIEQVLYARI